MSDSIAVAADEAVEKLYGARMSASFNNHGVSVHRLVLPGEEVDTHTSTIYLVYSSTCFYYYKT